MGHRWINGILISYDINEQEIVWKKEFAPDIRDFTISDIDID